MSTPQQPPWPGPAWNATPGGPTWGPAPSQPVRGRGPSAGLWLGLVAVLLFVIAAATGLYVNELGGGDYQQRYGVFAYVYAAAGQPDSTTFRLEGLGPVVGLVLWLVGVLIARTAQRPGAPLGLAAAGAALVLAWALDFVLGVLTGLMAGAEPPDLRAGGYLAVVLLLVAATAVVTSVVGISRATGPAVQGVVRSF